MNNTSWQAIVTAKNTNMLSLTETNLTAVKKAEGKQAKLFSAKEVVMPKRYSFDDNGGGYNGL